MEDKKALLYTDFEREAIPHMDALYNFALRLSGNEDDANDLLQETFMRAFRFFENFEKGTNCKAWLFRIMKNSYINDYRKESKRPETIEAEMAEEKFENMKPGGGDESHLSEDSFNSLLDDEVMQAIQSLPDDLRTVVLLSDIEGYTYEEIADFVDCPLGTVRSRLHRARKILYAKLYKYAHSKGFVPDGREEDE